MHNVNCVTSYKNAEMNAFRQRRPRIRSAGVDSGGIQLFSGSGVMGVGKIFSREGPLGYFSRGGPKWLNLIFPTRN